MSERRGNGAMALLEIEGLTVEVGGKEILKGIDLAIEPGEVHAIMGPNGSGKSTLSYVLAGRDGYEVTGGSIRFDGRDLLEMRSEEHTSELPSPMRSSYAVVCLNKKK